MVELSIIIPAYNEYRNLLNLVNKIEKLFEYNINLEVIIVNNGSSDETDNFLKTYTNKKLFNIKYISLKKNIGYGHGILQGINQASGKIIAWTHADLQTDPIDIIFGYSKIIKSKDRKVILKGKRKGRSFIDVVLTLAMSIICSMTFRMLLSDVNAQPKMFFSEFKSNLKTAPLDFSLDLHFLLEAKKRKYKILKQDVYFYKRSSGIAKGGGGSLKNKYRLILRTIKYIYQTKKNGNYNSQS